MCWRPISTTSDRRCPVQTSNASASRRLAADWVRSLILGDFTLSPRMITVTLNGPIPDVACGVVATHIDRDGMAVHGPQYLEQPIRWTGRTGVQELNDMARLKLQCALVAMFFAETVYDIAVALLCAALQFGEGR